MSRRQRYSFTVTSFLAALIIIVAVAGCDGVGTSSSGGVSAQATSTTPTTTSPSTPTTPSAGAPARQDPVLTVQTVFGAIQANDLNTLQGIVGTSAAARGTNQVAWGSNDLNAYVGNTNFDTALSYEVESNDGSTADIHVRGVITFHDPGHAPETRAAVVVYDISGDAILAAGGGSWVMTTFPNIFPRGCFDNTLPITAGLKTAA